VEYLASPTADWPLRRPGIIATLVSAAQAT
jgi:hypothetical protein